MTWIHRPDWIDEVVVNRLLNVFDQLVAVGLLLKVAEILNGSPHKLDTGEAERASNVALQTEASLLEAIVSWTHSRLLTNDTEEGESAASEGRAEHKQARCKPS